MVPGQDNILTITVTNGDGTKVYTVTVPMAADPAAPKLKGNASVSASVAENTAYTLDLTTVFEEGTAKIDTYKVSVDGKTGYMMAKYLKVTGEAHNGSARVFNANGGSYVNFRSRASLSASVIRTVPVGTTVKVLEKTTDWTKVEVDGKTGYISTWFLKF